MSNTTSSVNEVLNSTIGTIVNNNINPIVTIVEGNDVKTVDVLLQACSDIISPSYKPWFAKRFYKLDKNSVLNGASLARQDGKNSQKMFSHLVREAYHA